MMTTTRSSAKKSRTPYERSPLSRTQRAIVRHIAKRNTHDVDLLADHYGCPVKAVRQVARNDYSSSQKDNEDSDDEYIAVDRDELDQALNALLEPENTTSPSPSPPILSVRQHGGEPSSRQEMTLFEAFNDPKYDPRVNLRNRNRVSSSQPSSDNKQPTIHADSQPNQHTHNSGSSPSPTLELKDFLRTLPVDLSKHYSTLVNGGLETLTDLAAFRAYDENEVIDFLVQHFPAILPVHAFHIVKGLHRIDAPMRRAS